MLNDDVITIKFNVQSELLIKFPGNTTIEEIEQFILSKYQIKESDKDKMDILQPIGRTLNKEGKRSQLSGSIYREFQLDLQLILNKIFRNDYTSYHDENMSNVTFIPPFTFKENLVHIGSGSFGDVYKVLLENQILALKFINTTNN